MGTRDYKVGKGKPPIHGQIKKGEVRNPHGARAHKPKLPAVIRKLSAKEVEEVGSLVMMGDLPALKSIGSDPSASVLKVWVANCCVKAIMKGDAATLDLLLNRFIGKVRDKLEVTGEDGAPLGSTPEEVAERRKRIQAKINMMKELDAPVPEKAKDVSKPGPAKAVTRAKDVTQEKDVTK